MGIGQLQPIYQIYVTWTSIYRIKEVLKASTTFLVVKDAMFDVILGEMVLLGKNSAKNPEFFFLTINPLGRVCLQIYSLYMYDSLGSKFCSDFHYR